MFKSTTWCLSFLSLITVPFASATTVTVRSGNGTVEARIARSISCGRFNHTFTLNDFAGAQNGPAAFILSQIPFWISGLSSDPSAHWIGTNANARFISGNTALYAVSFEITSAFTSATMTLNYSVDDGIGASGDPLNTGVYLNGTAIAGIRFRLVSVRLKGFLKKVTEQIAQPEALLRLQILFAFEQEPARLLQHGHAALTRYAARFSRSDFVQCLVHFRHDVKTIEDVKRLGAFLANDLQVGFPHIGADEHIFEASSSPMTVKNP